MKHSGTKLSRAMQQLVCYFVQGSGETNNMILHGLDCKSPNSGADGILIQSLTNSVHFMFAPWTSYITMRDRSAPIFPNLPVVLGPRFESSPRVFLLSSSPSSLLPSLPAPRVGPGTCSHGVSAAHSSGHIVRVNCTRRFGADKSAVFVEHRPRGTLPVAAARWLRP